MFPKTAIVFSARWVSGYCLTLLCGGVKWCLQMLRKVGIPLLRQDSGAVIGYSDYFGVEIARAWRYRKLRETGSVRKLSLVLT